jgi:ankyrin repeat protein
MNDLANLIEAAKRGDLAAVAAMLERDASLIHQRDSLGATVLHYAAFAGHRSLVEALVRQGAEVNAIDGECGATPAGWAIEYLRELGGLLAMEIDDLAFAIERGHVEWVKRFLARLPALRRARDKQGNSFQLLAQQSGNPEIARLFASTAS